MGTMSPRPQIRVIDETEYSGRVAARINNLRIKQGLSTAALAKRIEEAGYPISTQTLYGWLGGIREVSLDSLPFVAKALGMKLLELLPAK